MRIWPVLFLFFTHSAIGQGGTWVWMKGSNNNFDSGYYGLKGISNFNNEPPPRYEPNYWTDLDGNFWLFGGEIDILNNKDFTCLNDLWKYNPNNNEWTWVSGEKYLKNPFGLYGKKGIPSSNNYPSARRFGSACWTDHNGDLWMFGGSGYTLKTGKQENVLNDLWRYHITTNEWTWIGGSADTAFNRSPIYGTIQLSSKFNDPGPRYESRSTWVDSLNNLWLFAGDDYTGTGALGDLWYYNISTNKWTWMKGPNQININGHYGKKNVEDISNYPSSRITHSHWKDNKGNFYFFGGTGFTIGLKTDVWKYSIKSNSWTWIAGDTLDGDSGTYVTLCKKESSNNPPGMWDNETIQTNECSELFWSFGGGNVGKQNFINDLWLFDKTSLNWELVAGGSGENINDTIYNYGVLGVPSKLNSIPGKVGFAIWSDLNGNIYIFGGSGYGGQPNDLWKFIPDTSCFHPAINNKRIHINDTTITCSDSSFFKLAGLGLHIISISPPGSVLIKQDTGITFKPQDTTSYVITYYQNECNGFDSLHYRVNVKPCTVPPPVNSYIQTFISSSGIWNIANKTAPLNVTLYDALGQMLYKDSNYQNTLDTHKWAAGVYLYQVIDGNANKYVGKICIY